MAQRTSEEWQVLAAVAPREVIRQYEDLVAGLGLRARFVTLSTVASLGLVPAAHNNSTTESVLVAKYSPPSLTIAILHQGAVRLFRTASIDTDNTGDSVQTVQQILEAVHPSVAYFQDHYGASLTRTYLCGLGASSDAIGESLSRELHLPAAPLLEDNEAAGDPVQSERLLAALMGIARERRSQ
jgi:hypothetical protein